MSLASDLSILYSNLMVGRDHPSLSQTLDLLPLDIAEGGFGSNLVKNGSFELWPGDITNVAPSGWSLKGTPTDVSRDTGDRDNLGGAFAVKITSNGSGNEGITITLSGLKASTQYGVRVRAKATASDTARIWTTGGSVNLDENTASTSWVDVEGTFTTDGTPTNVVLNLGSDTATDIVWFDQLMVVQGGIGVNFSPQYIPINSIVQIRNFQTGAVATGTTAMPFDDTIPQNTEGDEYMTLTIAPTNANNKLLIEVTCQFNHTSASLSMSMALFQDSIANALAATSSSDAIGSISHNISLNHEMTAGTTNVITFKLRAGGSTGATTTFNGIGGGRIFGGVMASSITIMEIKQ